MIEDTLNPHPELIEDLLRPAALDATFDRMLLKSHREGLALRLFLGLCEGALQSRRAFTDAGALDLIALAAERCAAELERLKEST